MTMRADRFRMPCRGLQYSARCYITYIKQTYAAVFAKKNIIMMMMCSFGETHLPVDDEAHLLFSCPATSVLRRERRFAQLPFTSLQDLMCCRDGGAVFVHKGMKIADAAAVAAARQRPR
jgi:hypothetical protein